MSPEDAIEMRVEHNVVLFQVLDEVVSAYHPSDLDELVVVVVSVEERLLLKQHGGEHGPQTPHVQGVVVQLVLH